MSTSHEPIFRNAEMEATERAARNRTFATMFRPDETIWLVREELDPEGPVWRLDFLRQGKQGEWLYHRYSYDIPTRVVYFRGTRPVATDELTRLRRQGTRFSPHETASTPTNAAHD